MSELSTLDIIIVWIMINAMNRITWLMWRLLNALSDRYLRISGWDKDDEWTPFVDYVPFWRLFRGTADMGQRAIRRRI